MSILKHPVLRILGRIIGIFIIISLLLSLIDVIRKQGILKEYEDAYNKAKQENERLKDAIAQAQTPEFVEREARDKLGLVKEGETLVLMDTSQIQGTQTSAQESGQNFQESDSPNWKKWIKLFF